MNTKIILGLVAIIATVGILSTPIGSAQAATKSLFVHLTFCCGGSDSDSVLVTGLDKDHNGIYSADYTQNHNVVQYQTSYQVAFTATDVTQGHDFMVCGHIDQTSDNFDGCAVGQWSSSIRNDIDLTLTN